MFSTGWLGVECSEPPVAWGFTDPATLSFMRVLRCLLVRWPGGFKQEVEGAAETITV